MRRPAVLILLLVAALWVGGRMRAEESIPSPPKAGTFRWTLAAGGFERTVQVHIPTGYQPGAAPPLVLLLHGAGGNGLQALEKYGWDAKADAEGFLVAAPDGLPALPRLRPNFFTNPPLWHSGQLKPGSPRAAVDDVAFVRQLLHELQTKAPYDARRVFLAGHSNGGGMAFRLAAEMSERFAAMGTVAGMMAVDNPRPQQPLPTLYLLGTNDPLVPLDGGEVTLPWGTRTNPPAAEPLETWAAALGCKKEPRVISHANRVKKVEYPSRRGGPTLTVLYLEGHGHPWPGGQGWMPSRMVGPNDPPLNATDALWDFFESVPPR